MRTSKINRDSDSDDYQPPKRNSQSRGKKGEKPSSGESDQERFVSNLKPGNFADLNDSIYLNEPETKNIRVVSRQRPSTLLRPSGTAPAPSAGFVPREVKERKPKSMRIISEDSYENESERRKPVPKRHPPPRGEDRREDRRDDRRQLEEDEDTKLPASWAKAPKKFLEEPEQQEDYPPLRQNKDWNPGKNQKSRNSNEENSPKNAENSRNSGNYRPQSNQYSRQPSHRRPDHDEDDLSQHSADTIDEDRDRNNKRKGGRDDDAEDHIPVFEYNPNKPLGSGRDVDDISSSNKNRIKEIFEENSRPPSSQGQRRQPDKSRPQPRQDQRNEEEAFMAYSIEKSKQGVVLPRKSGRYDPDEYSDERPPPRGNNSNTNSTRYQYRPSQEQENQHEQQNDNFEEDEDVEVVTLSTQANKWSSNPNSKYQSNTRSRDPPPPSANNGGGGWFSSSNKSNNSGMASSSSNNALMNTYNTMCAKASFVLIAHPHGVRSRMVQCTIVRDRSSIHGKLYPSYELILEEPKKTLIIARKMSMNRTSNYHLFDMTRGAASQNLSKKAGNYLGKLRAKNMNRTGYSLLNQKEEKEEIGGILFDRVTFMDQINEGNQPRKMKMIVPLLNEDSVPIPIVCQQTYGIESLPELLQLVDENKLQLPDDLRILHTKDPVFENGNYRLNFHGRVSMPSVKNFQIVSADDIDDVKCQFGKVEKDVFHLDYKEPFNAIQAFALALCQFNL